MIYEEEEKTALKNKAGRFIKPEKKEAVVEEQIKVITLPEKLTIKELADKADVKYTTLLETTTGRCAGHDLIPVVRDFMQRYQQRAQKEA